MNLSPLNHPLTHSARQLQPLLCCGLVIGLCAACNKPLASTPLSRTTSNTTEAVTVNHEPMPAKEAPEFPPAPEGKVLRHAVFFSFKEESSEEDIQRVVDAFRELPSKIDEIIDFQWGVNNSPEGLDDRFTHCFLLTFKDEAGRAAYLPHDAHKAFGDVLRPHKDKVFVVDRLPGKEPVQ